MTTHTNGTRAGRDGVVIAGGGLAGMRCAERLRREGYDGAIRIACAEAHLPYDRPPLSKGVLTGAHADGALPFHDAGWYEKHSIDLLLGVRAASLEPTEHRLGLSNGGTLRYERLLIATGGRPRTLPLLDGRDNVSVLRTIDDAVGLRKALARRPRLAVVGAGFIGLEIAATARRLGVEVTLIEAANAPLAGVLGAELGGWFARLHAAEGVDVRLGQTVDRVDADAAVRSLTLSDGSVVEVDRLVVGVGIAADVAWLHGCGLEVSVGVPVDPHGRTAIPDVFAAGDAAATLDRGCGRHLPGSHWEAAGRQGARAARVMLGLDPGDVPLSSFWTDQYGLRIQYIGQTRLADAIQLDGDPESRSFTALFTRAGTAVAALLVDRPRSLPAVRMEIEKGRTT